jgi:hypothetical protein
MVYVELNHAVMYVCQMMCTTKLSTTIWAHTASEHRIATKLGQVCKRLYFKLYKKTLIT